jgi:hypothetical protein
VAMAVVARWLCGNGSMATSHGESSKRTKSRDQVPNLGIVVGFVTVAAMLVGLFIMCSMRTDDACDVVRTAAIVLSAASTVLVAGTRFCATGLVAGGRD